MKLINFAVLVLIALCQSASANGVPQLKLLDPEGPVSTTGFPIEARNALNKYPTAIGYRFNPKALEQLAKELPDKKLGDAYDVRLPNEKGVMLDLRMHLVRSKPDGRYPSFAFETSSREDRYRSFGSITIHVRGGKVSGMGLSALLDDLSRLAAVNYRVYKSDSDTPWFSLVSVSDTDPIYQRENARPNPYAASGVARVARTNLPFSSTPRRDIRTSRPRKPQRGGIS